MNNKELQWHLLAKKGLPYIFLLLCFISTSTQARRNNMHQRVGSLCSRVLNVNDLLMGSDLKVSTCILQTWGDLSTLKILAYIGWQRNMTYGFYNHVVLATSMIWLHKSLNSVTQYMTLSLILIFCVDATWNTIKLLRRLVKSFK